MSKIFCISDIHGHYKELMLLYKKLPINPKKDKMVFLGDYIDRGPDTKKVIQQLIKWQKLYPHWVFLFGNHEDFMKEALVRNTGVYGFQAWDLWIYNGGDTTKQSYYPKGLTASEKAIASISDFIPQSHLDFIASLPRYYEDDKYIYVHGGLKPGKTAAETLPYDLIWIRDEFIDSNYGWGKKVIFGHSADGTGQYNKAHKKFQPIIMPNKIGIDTAVCYGAYNGLTCLELPSEKFYFQPTLWKPNQK